MTFRDLRLGGALKEVLDQFSSMGLNVIVGTIGFLSFTEHCPLVTSLTMLVEGIGVNALPLNELYKHKISLNRQKDLVFYNSVYQNNFK